MGQSWNIPNMNSEPGKSKWLAKENLEKMSHKANSNCHESVTQGLSESVLVSINTCCTLFLQVNTLHILLLSTFVGILFCRAEGPLLLITGLMARNLCFHCHDPASASGQEPKPCFKLLQAEATRDQGEFCPMRLMQWKAFSNCSAHLSKTLLDTDVSGTRNAERSKLWSLCPESLHPAGEADKAIILIQPMKYRTLQCAKARARFSDQDGWERLLRGGNLWKEFSRKSRSYLEEENTFQTKSTQADAELEATRFRETHACLYNKATGKAHPMTQDLSPKGWGSHCRILGQ